MPHSHPSDPITVQRPTSDIQHPCQMTLFKSHLRTLAGFIEQTKHELAALHPSDQQQDGLMLLGQELGAIATDTDTAAQEILAAAETIDDLCGQMRYGQWDASDLSDRIAASTAAIFTACNFQDITGQRITKMVGMIRDLETHLAALTAIWGAAPVLAEAACPSRRCAPADDSDLLNGPALHGQAISQHDVDRFFES